MSIHTRFISKKFSPHKFYLYSTHDRCNTVKCDAFLPMSSFGIVVFLNARLGRNDFVLRNYSKPSAFRKLYNNVCSICSTCLMHNRTNFESGFLKINDYPKDPFKGFFVPSAVVFARIREENTTFRAFSNLITIPLAVPDMSMPYNVLMITCTVLSMAVTTILKLGTARLELSEEHSTSEKADSNEQASSL